METEKLLTDITQILENLSIPYLVTGGVAVAIWGRVRATYDIDIVIKIQESHIPDLVKALRELSKAGYIIDEEVARDAFKTKGEFNFLHSESGLKVDFWIKKDTLLAKKEFERRVTQKIAGRDIYFISPEDLILRKLEWHKMSESAKQLEDIESILKISGKKLDMKYLKQWAEKLEVLDILNKLTK